MNEFKRGTNYNRRMGGSPDPGAMRAAVASQRERCARGEHAETVAEENRVTYLGYGKRIEPGTRYCRCCQAILTGESGLPRPSA